MLGFFRKLLPNRTEWRDILLDGWKYILAVMLVGVALWVEKSRDAIWDLWKWFSHVWVSSLVLPGWVLITLSGLAFAAVVLIFMRIIKLVGDPVFKSFCEGEYDGIYWEWRWSKGRVEQDSMRPFCKACETELLLDPGNDGRPFVRCFCTSCNSGFRISGLLDLPEHVVLKIERDQRTGNWKKIREQRLLKKLAAQK